MEREREREKRERDGESESGWREEKERERESSRTHSDYIKVAHIFSLAYFPQQQHHHHHHHHLHRCHALSLSPRYTFHALRNTLSPSPMVQARTLDRLEPAVRQRWIEEWRSMRGGGGGGRDAVGGSGRSASPVHILDPTPFPPSPLVTTK